MHLRPKGAKAPAVYDRLDKIQYQVEQLRTKRTRDTGAARRFRCCLRALCLDLDAAYQLDPLMVVGVRRDRTALTQNPIYPRFVTARPFIDALDGLIATGHVEQVSLGNEGSGKSTRIRGTAKLRQSLLIGEWSTPHLEDHSELIRLSVGKRDNKKRISYQDNVQTMRWRKDLERINWNNSNYDIRIDLSHDEWQALEARRRAEAVTEAQRNKQPFDYMRVDMSRNRLHRVFNAKDWTKGGRFYGAWWQQIPKPYRQHITINGKPVCEYDFSAIHLRLLYTQVGATVPHIVAPYDKPYGEGYRNVVKLAFNVLLNCSGTPSAKLVPEFSPQSIGMTWHQFLDGIIKHHSVIASYFKSEIGPELQRMDAEIAEAVMLRFTDMQQPCLPIHDSFITYATLADEIADITAEASLRIIGVKLPSRKEYVSVQTGADGLVEDDISNLLDKLALDH